MSETATNYVSEAIRDAKETAWHFLDEIVEQFIDKGEVSDDLNNDYPDGDAYHHEQHVDHDWRPVEAVVILEQLDDHEETDSGLWEGLDWKAALGAIAAYTYGNAVYHHWRALVDAINEDEELQELRDAYATDEEAPDPRGQEAVPTSYIRARIDSLIEAY